MAVWSHASRMQLAFSVLVLSNAVFGSAVPVIEYTRGPGSHEVGSGAWQLTGVLGNADICFPLQVSDSF